jgi:hypothetical protein
MFWRHTPVMPHDFAAFITIFFHLAVSSVKSRPPPQAIGLREKKKQKAEQRELLCGLYTWQKLALKLLTPL